MIPRYDSLSLRVGRTTGEGGYEVVARGPTGAEARCEFALPFDEQEIEGFVLDMSRGRHGKRGGGRGVASLERAEALGRKLFDAVFKGGVHEIFHAAIEASRQRDRGLRVTLNLTAVPELSHVPWEFMYEEPRFLSWSTWTPIVRYLGVPRSEAPLAVDPPLRILGLVSSPAGYPELDVQEEKDRLERSLRPLIDQGLVELRWTGGATLGGLLTELSQREYHVFHFIGHGDYDERGRNGFLVLEDRDGRAEAVNGRRLATILCDFRSVRVAVLNACEGARSASDDPFAGVATRLVQQELPAVIAMQFEISDESAITFAQYFYDAIALGYAVDSAMAHARRGIVAEHTDSLEWATPVLFMRVSDGRVFAVDWEQVRATTPRIDVELEADPPVVPAGREVIWRLSVTNTGSNALEGVVPVGPDGRPMSGPVGLASGADHVFHWRERIDDHTPRVVTVEGHDERGRRVEAEAAATATAKVSRAGDGSGLTRTKGPPPELPTHLREAIAHPFAGTREAAVAELALLRSSAQTGMAQAAEAALELLAEDDSRRVCAAAVQALGWATARPARPRRSASLARDGRCHDGGMRDLAWEPTPEYVERANVTRLMRALGVESIDELRRRSVEDVEWYWDAAVKDLGLEFSRPYSQVLDLSDGPPWARWFADGRINLVWNCVDRWAHSDRRDHVALIGESETGAVRRLTFKELHREVDRVAAGLSELGVGRRDAVGVFMPMVPEAAVAAYAIAKLGAIYMPIFSGFAPSAVAARLRDGEAKVLFTADGTWRRGQHGLMKAAADEAVGAAPSVEKVVVLENLGVDVPMTAGRDLAWAELTAPHDHVHLDPTDTGAEDPFMIAYTSGTTGRPKGAVHVHGGFLVKIASEVAYQLDLHPGEPFYWVTDMGWIMGPLAMVGAHAVGGAMVMYEGAPDFPEPDRIWRTVAEQQVAMLGISPTLIRALKPRGEEWPARHDLSSLRILGSTGEPWNPEPYRWLQRVTGDGRVPILNISGGTEIGACFLGPYPVEPIKVCSLGAASLGMDVDIFDASGRPVRGEVGELVCKQPWPGMTRGIWRDPERYLETYWSTFEGVWRHGDWARIDEDGQWFLLGRSDDTINVAGKRLGPAEVESVLVSHEAVTEAAVVGIPDETKGEAVWCFVVAPRADGGLAGELSDLVARELGRPFKPSKVAVVDELPKTRSAKILRRAVRAAAMGEDPGDLSSAENPQAIDGIRAAIS